MERLIAAMGSASGEISKDLFHLQVPWGEKVIRAVVVYAFLLLALRLFGRRELGQFTAFDLVVLLTLSNILQNAMIGNDSSLLGGLIGASVLLTANLALAYAVFRSRSFQRLVTGQPRILIKDGAVHKSELTHIPLIRTRSREDRWSASLPFHAELGRRLKLSDARMVNLPASRDKVL